MKFSILFPIYVSPWAFLKLENLERKYRNFVSIRKKRIQNDNEIISVLSSGRKRWEGRQTQKIQHFFFSFKRNLQ